MLFMPYLNANTISKNKMYRKKISTTAIVYKYNKFVVLLILNMAN
jgi:hypothetical protein